jgi:hypothetical protein
MFLVLVESHTQQLSSSICQILFESGFVVILRFERGKFIDSCVPIGVGEPLTASLSLPSTIRAGPNTDSIVVATREVEVCKISMTCNISFHAAGYVGVGGKGCFVIERGN